MSLINDVIGDFNKLDFSNKKMRQFGIIFFFLFIIISGIMFYNKHITLLYVSLTAGIILLILGLVSPKLLVPVYKIWMFFGLILNWIIIRFLIFIIYYIIFTIINLYLKLTKKDPLRIKDYKKKNTAWIKIDRDSLSKYRLERMF